MNVVLYCDKNVAALTSVFPTPFYLQLTFCSFPALFVSLSLTLSLGCQVCGREEEAAAGLPSHGDEQTDPDTAGVHSSPHQRDPAVSAAFLSVSGHIQACSIWHLSFCVGVCGCVWVRKIQGKGCQHTCRERYRPPVCERLMQRFRNMSGEIRAGAFRECDGGEAECKYLCDLLYKLYIQNEVFHSFFSTENSNIIEILMICPFKKKKKKSKAASYIAEIPI